MGQYHYLASDRAASLDIIFEHGNLYAGLLAGDGTVLEVSSRLLSLCDAGIEDVLGKAFWRAPWWQSRPADAETVRAAVLAAADGAAAKATAEVGSQGKPVSLDIELQPVGKGLGRAAYIVFTGHERQSLDIVQSQEAESRLRQLTAELAEVQRLAKIGSWEWALAGDTLTWSDELHVIFKRPPGSPAPRGTDFLALFVPADADRLDRALQALRACGQPFELELEGRCGSGTSRWVIARGEAERDLTGRIVKLRGTVQDVSERRRMVEARKQRLEQMAQQQRRLRQMSRHLLAVQEEERRRMALELHDVVSPNLAALKINLGIIYARMPQHILHDLGSRLSDTQTLLDDTTASLRKFCANLRPAALDYAGLRPAIEDYAEQFSERTGIAVELLGAPSERRLPPEIEILLFRIVQEALTNCAKHAHADFVTIELEHDSEHGTMTISDNGVGFDSGELGDASHKPGIGLLTMSERARFAGGSFSLESRPGDGTRIRVKF